MSEFTTCNYCNYRRMLRQGCRIATPQERKDLWDKDSKEFTASMGTGVVMVDKDGKFASWFMELTNHCVC